MTKKFCLGTVQFGMKYGIKNKNGQPSKKEVFDILDVARKNGINTFDTAAIYGSAEEILGEYISERKCNEKVKVISKLRPNLINDDCKKSQVIIKTEINRSLEKLKICQLDGYLLHTPTDFYNTGVIEGLITSKKRGLVKNIGVSVYEFKHAMDVAKSEAIDYIQVPYSIFDQRMDQDSFFKHTQKNDIKVFARSAFLQGLILMNPNEVPPDLKNAKEHLNTLDDIINTYGTSRLEIAIHFVYNHPGIDYLVFGVDSIEQLLQNMAVVKNKKNLDECVKKIRNSFSKMEESIIFPSLWKKA